MTVMTTMSELMHKHAHILACMHTIFLHAQGHILANLGQIKEIKVSMESGEYASPSQSI